MLQVVLNFDEFHIVHHILLCYVYIYISTSIEHFRLQSGFLIFIHIYKYIYIYIHCVVYIYIYIVYIHCIYIVYIHRLRLK